MRQDEIIIQAFNFLKKSDVFAASNVISTYYPKIHPTNRPLVIEAQKLGFSTSPLFINDKPNNNYNRKTFSEKEKDSIFLNDLYQCRYSGLKLFSPPVLTIISLYLNEVFPAFKIPHFPLDKNHQGIYTLYPSPDHVVSLYAGGSNELANLVTSSSTLNMIKSQYSNAEMGWKILDKSKLDADWDGGRTWFLELISDKKEFESLILKSIELQTFHQKINPALYFNKWANAFNKNNSSNYQTIRRVEKFISKTPTLLSVDTNERKEISSTLSNTDDIKSLLAGSISNTDVNSPKQNAQISLNTADIKSLPIGSICRNKKTRNRYVCLKKEMDGIKIFSLSENITMKITTKPLLVNVEFTPSLNVSSIVELPVEIYTAEQMTLIREACKRWCNGRFNNLSNIELQYNTIYQYLLRGQ